MSAAEFYRLASRIREKYPEPTVGESYETAIPKLTMRSLADIAEEVAYDSLDEDE